MFQGESKELPFLIGQGFDYLAEYGGDSLNIDVLNTDASFFAKNIGAGGLFPGVLLAHSVGKKFHAS
jgi:hypothetical protein